MILQSTAKEQKPTQNQSHGLKDITKTPAALTAYGASSSSLFSKWKSWVKIREHTQWYNTGICFSSRLLGTGPSSREKGKGGISNVHCNPHSWGAMLIILGKEH